MGTVQSVADTGDLRVRYSNNMTWTLNPDVATKVHDVEHSFGKGSPGLYA